MKKIIGCLLAICMIFLLTACGGGKDTAVDLNALATELAGSAAFTENIGGYAVDAKLAGPTYGFDAGSVKSCLYYYNSTSNEELLAVEANDADAAGTVEQCCRSRIEMQKAALAAYNPDAIPRLDSALVVRSGNYVVFVVAQDSGAAKTVVDKYLK